MASDRAILHLVKKKIPDPLPHSRIMACTLLIFSYAPNSNNTAPSIGTIAGYSKA